MAAEMWDTSGARELGKVEMLGYMRWDAVFLCFDVMDKVQMLSIISWVRLFFSGHVRLCVCLCVRVMNREGSLGN